MEIPSGWNETELRLLRTVELFQHKPVIMAKAESRLEQLRASLVDYLSQNPDLCPPGADREKGQIVRGENLKGFPFVSLDMPQLFHKQQFFTCRTLFWWGHYLGFSLIVMGGNFSEYLGTLLQNLDRPEAEGLWWSRFKTPWEWELTPEQFDRASAANVPTLRAHGEQHGFLKLMRVYPVTDQNFPNLDWTETGLTSYQTLLKLIQSP